MRKFSNFNLLSLIFLLIAIVFATDANPARRRTTEPFFIPIGTKISSTRKTFKVGHTIVVTCKVTGYPYPSEVRWLKDHKPLVANYRYRFSVEGDKHKLTINDAQISDSGSYHCEAENKYSLSFSTVKVSYIPDDCKNNYSLADCDMIARSNYHCRNGHYAKICCKSCAKDGQLKFNS